MKNRNEILGDAHKVLLYLSEYKVLKLEQIDRILSYKPETVRRSIIKYLVKNDRAFIVNDLISVTEAWEEGYDKARIEAFWIYIDYMEDVTYNSTAEFPAKLTFTTLTDEYVVFVAEHGQEALLKSYFRKLADDGIKYIVSIRDEEQIKMLDCPCIAGYCMVAKHGGITYYKPNRRSV